MSFIERPYADIVTDVLNSLTHGVSGETHRIDYDALARPAVVPDIMLTRRPVRRVSMVRGMAAEQPGQPPIPVTFTLNEYDLVALPNDPGSFDRIRFRPLARRKPAPGTDVAVSYYPRTTDPVPLTDLNVGSVTRTLLEAISRELAALYAQLNIVYDSGFVETAQGSALDKVVALISYSRLRAGRAVGTVTFSRRAGASGDITIPAGTPVTDSLDKIRYVTSERYDMLAGQGVGEVRVQGALATTPVVAAGQLTVIQRAIAGLETVVNEAATTRASEDETDEALRARSRDALFSANKGTVEAIRHGLLTLPQVKDARVVEMPNGVPGEIAVTVQLSDGNAPAGDLPREILERIEALRPAGIRVVSGQAATVVLAARLTLVLAGAGASSAEIAAIRAAASARLVTEVARKAVGERIRIKPLVAALLGDARIADATLELGEAGQPPSADDFQPANGSGVSLAAQNVQFAADSFADAAPAAGQPVTVELRARVAVTPQPGTTADEVQAQLTARLTTYAAALRPGTIIDSASLLSALRNDAAYGIDPLGLVVTLSAQDQFVQIAQGGNTYTVGANQTFVVASVELAA